MQSQVHSITDFSTEGYMMDVTITAASGDVSGESPIVEEKNLAAVTEQIALLGELLQQQSSRLEWIIVLQDNHISSQRDQEILLQYTVGLLAFLCGMLLAAIFLFGLKLR